MRSCLISSISYLYEELSPILQSKIACLGGSRMLKHCHSQRSLCMVHLIWVHGRRERDQRTDRRMEDIQQEAKRTPGEGQRSFFCRLAHSQALALLIADCLLDSTAMKSCCACGSLPGLWNPLLEGCLDLCPWPPAPFSGAESRK